MKSMFCFFFFQAEDGIRDFHVTGVQTCALPISRPLPSRRGRRAGRLRALRDHALHPPREPAPRRPAREHARAPRARAAPRVLSYAAGLIRSPASNLEVTNMSHTHKSTNGRSPGTWPLRAAFGALGAVSPALAGRAGARLFLTPPRHRVPPREREALAATEPFALAHGGGILRGFSLGTGPAVLLVHDWGGRSGDLAPLAQALAAAGCTAVAFDAPAHGRSSGHVASMLHFADAAVAVAERFAARVAAGHSLGAAALAFSPRVRAAVDARIVRRVGLPYDAVDLVRLAPAAPPPFLVVHDRDDREVPLDRKSTRLNSSHVKISY